MTEDEVAFSSDERESERDGGGEEEDFRWFSQRMPFEHVREKIKRTRRRKTMEKKMKIYTKLMIEEVTFFTFSAQMHLK